MAEVLATLLDGPKLTFLPIFNDADGSVKECLGDAERVVHHSPSTGKLSRRSQSTRATADGQQTLRQG